jgi:hypothetical protein
VIVAALTSSEMLASWVNVLLLDLLTSAEDFFHELTSAKVEI